MKNLWNPTYCNCLVWAIIMSIAYGGSIKFIRSERWSIFWGVKGFHVLWNAPDGKTYSYVPHNKCYVGPLRALLEFFFKGYVEYPT